MQVRRMLRATGVVVVASLSYGTAAYADSVIVGQVVSADGKTPITDVVVTATSPNLQGEQVVVTDAQGQYRIPQLPPGVYTLRFDKESFKPFSRPEIQLRLDRTIRVNVELLPEAFQTTIDVVARPPTIDVGSTSQGVNVDQDFIKRIAVNRPGGKGGAARSFDSLAELAPGAQNDAYGVSINGTTSPENGYVVDGLSTNDPAFGINASPLSVEFVQDVNIITGGYMPEYGRSTGGVLNAVTKSGSNEFHGTVFGNVTPGLLEGTRAQVLNESSVVGGLNSLTALGDFGATLGGPILKDKLWFFAGVAPSFTRYNHQRFVSRILIQRDANGAPVLDADGNPTVLTDKDTGYALTERIAGSERNFLAESRSLQYMGKLTYLVNQDHNLSISVTGTPSVSGGNGALEIDPQTGGVATRLNGDPDRYGRLQELAGTTAVGLKYAGAFNEKKFLVDANVGWFHQTASTLPDDGTRPGDSTGLAGLSLVQYRKERSIAYFEPGLKDIVALCDDGVGGTVSCPAINYFRGGPGFINDGLLDRMQANAKGTYLLDLLGSHVLKAGVDVELLSYYQKKAFSGGVTHREALSGATWQDFRRYGFLRGPDDAEPLLFQEARSTSTTAGGFLQDSWTIAGRVTVNAGVRYDTQWLYGGDNSLAFVLSNQISPRVGLIVDPMANGRMKVYANFARYYEQVPLNLLDRAFPGERRFQANRAAGVGKCDPDTLHTREGQDQCETNATLVASAPTSLNPSRLYTGGKSEKEPVDPNIQPQSSDEYLLGAEYELMANIRLGANYIHRNMGAVIEDMSRDDGNTYFLGNPGMGFAKEFPKATRNYDAVTVFLNRTFSDGWLAQANYTWSRLFGNYPGLFRPENAQLDPNILSDFDLVSLLKNREGLLPYDRTHSIKLFGAKEFNLSKDLSTSIGLSYRGNSGGPISYIGAHPLYGPSEAFIIERGSGGRTPWVNNIDSNVGVNYRVGKTNVVSLTVDVFNIFNFQGVTAVDQNYTFASVLPVEGGVKAGDLTPGMVDKIDDETGEVAGKLTDEDLNPNFKKPTQYQAPRQIRFGLKYTF